MTNRIDNANPQANMYGVLPCPQCSSPYRWPSQPVHPQHPDSIVCDDCGFVEKIDHAKEEPGR